MNHNFNNSVFIAAEIGINHNGDMELARKTIIAAKNAGVNAVKFQNYFTDDFILDKSLTYSYKSQGNEVTESQHDMFKRYELSFEQLRYLKEICEQEGLIFFSTPTSPRGISDLEKLDVSLYKNGSDLLVNLDLIQNFARTGKTTVLSTGMANLAEIDEAVRAFESAGGSDLIILHCTSSYPTSPDDVNLNKITSLKSAFGYKVGFSDHTDGIVSSIGAVVLGAVFIEKHFTLDKSLPGPDHSFSSDPAEMKLLVNSIRTIEKNLGTSKLGPTQTEAYGRENFRLSCVAKNDMKKGHVLTSDDIAFSRPATGLSPKYRELLIGRVLKEDISKSELLTFNSVN